MLRTAEARGLRLAQTAEVLLRPCPLHLLLLGSLTYAILFCLLQFNIGFLLGNSAYWQAPRGLAGGSWADISTALSGYDTFVRDVWNFPLFQTTTLGLPHPVNIISTDSVPIVCLLGRLLYRGAGLFVNPFGIWAAFCFIASALAMTSLVAELGGRSVAAALMATVCGLCMPALIARWGHMSLMAHWEPVAALLVYFRSKSGELRTSGIAWTLLLATISLWTQAYLFVMVMGILTAAFVQALLDRRLPAIRVIETGALFALILGALVFVSGFFETGGPLVAAGFGYFSMNLLSPVAPCASALFPCLSIHYDATNGQYEGFGYLGAGILFLVALVLPRLSSVAVKSAGRHVALMIVLALYLIFAISNTVYLGEWRIVTVPLPAGIEALANIFRSSGRFVWPCLYMLAAALIVCVPARWGKAGGYLLIIAAVLQVIDTSPLRLVLTTFTRNPAAMAISEADWISPIRKHGFLEVMPSFECMDKGGAVRQHIALELQLMASRLGVPTNTVYAARHEEACNGSNVHDLPSNELLVLLSPSPHPRLPSDIASACASSTGLTVCSRVLDHAELAWLAATRQQ